MEMTNHIEDAAHAIESRVRPQIDEARRRISDVSTQAQTFVRQHPGACLVGAVAVGYLIARLARR